MLQRLPPLLILPLMMAVSAAAAQTDIPLVPHEAVYDLTLQKATRRSGIVTARGRIVMALRGGPCEGWSETTRMMVRYVFRRRGLRITDARNTSWEAADGSVFSYASSNYLNGRKTRETRLRAVTGGENTGSVRFSLPKMRTTSLPSGAIFPQAALKRVIARARRGKAGFSYLGYEGFENGRARLISVLIGKPRPGDARFAALKSLRAWPVSFAYYPLDGEGKPREKDFGLPEYELAFVLHENGVVSDARFIYRDMTLAGRLTSLKILPGSVCR